LVTVRSCRHEEGSGSPGTINFQGNTMNLKNTCRALLTLIGASLLSVSLISPASAARGASQGHGVKCYWVVVSSDPATGAQVLQYVCSRGA